MNYSTQGLSRDCLRIIMELAQPLQERSSSVQIFLFLLMCTGRSEQYVLSYEKCLWFKYLQVQPLHAQNVQTNILCK